MERKYSITYEGIRVDIVEIKSDERHHAQISVLGEPGFTKRPFREFRDAALEAQGNICIAKFNGSLFFTQGSYTYANGIEKAYGVVHENDDAAWDNNLGFWHNDGVPFIYPPWHIKKIINESYVRGAMTAAFGLINNGRQDIRGARYYYDKAKGRWITEPGRGVYRTKSGRTIIGKKPDGTIVGAVFDGVTGRSGLTGYQTYLLAKRLGLNNAVCMDGGGSSYGEYKGVPFNNSSRDGANAIGFYIRLK